MSLTLPTPTEFPAFPYRPPYDIQTDLMRHLYAAIEHRKITIVESPTGTGKTLSLLCASLTWLGDEKNRAMKGQLAALRDSLNTHNEPDWVFAQTFDKCKRQLELTNLEFEERLAKARKKEQALRKLENARVTKKRKLTHDSEVDVEGDDSIFLPDDTDLKSDDGANLSPAVRNLMKKLEHSRTQDPLNSVDTEVSCTKIYYASRTHSQLSQLLPELRKLDLAPSVSHIISPPDTTKLSAEELDSPRSRTVPLASRTHLCINDDLRAKGGDLDEGCRELLSGGKGKRCPHLPPLDEESRMLDFRDQILANPKDIEDLVLIGKSSNTCPYFGTRRAIPQAELVTLPYNLLLQRHAREALGIDLRDQVVIVDEAHNLIDTILHLHCVMLPAVTLRTSLHQLRLYVQRFQTRLTTMHALHLKRLVVFLTGLDRLATTWKDEVVSKSCDEGQSNTRVQVMTVSVLVARLGAKVDGVNLLEIQSYLRSSKIARKINGYNDNVAQKAAGKDSIKVASQKRGTTPPLHAVESFILALTNDSDDGRITLALTGDSGNEHVQFKYQHLNPSTHFTEIVEAARCVILAGGTMSPVSDLVTQLLPSLTSERLSTFSCGHVIPPSNLQSMIICKGPRGKDLQLKYNQRTDPSILEELGQTLFNLINIVPDGMVVFFPSYAFLEAVKVAWTKSGLLTKLNAKKKLFYEPRESSNVESVLHDYGQAIQAERTSTVRKGGALLLAVVGAKLSEGLNFTDELARAVVLVGLPYANLGSPELKERMNYVNDLERKAGGTRKINAKDAATELYENLCMKAVNQSIGRAIRHRNDWASLILIDSRYASSRVRDKLPHWIGKDITVAQTFGQAVKTLASFYRNKR